MFSLCIQPIKALVTKANMAKSVDRITWISFFISTSGLFNSVKLARYRFKNVQLYFETFLVTRNLKLYDVRR